MKSKIKQIIHKLEKRSEYPALSPASVWDPEISNVIGELFSNINKDKNVLMSIKSGLYLWNDDLDSSHTVAQEISNATGSYWHAIMHRREPDFSNSKYWWRRVGSHPLFTSLSKDIYQELGKEKVESLDLNFQQDWNPIVFVDLCERAKSGFLQKKQQKILQEIQLIEIKSLLNFSLKNI